MGHKIVCVFEIPDSKMKADAEEAFWKTVASGDVKQLKEYNVHFKIRELTEEDGSLLKTAKEQVKTLFVGNGKR